MRLQRSVRWKSVLCVAILCGMTWHCGRGEAITATSEEIATFLPTAAHERPKGDIGSFSVSIAGDGQPGPDSDAPPRVVRIALGAKHSCALMDRGDVYCWGRNTSLQVGIPGPAKVMYPTRVEGVENAVWLDANAHHTCAVLKDGSLSCWGIPGAGQKPQLPTREKGVKRSDRVWIGAKGGACTRFSDGSNCLSTAKGGDDSLQWLAGKDHECLAFRDGHVECRGVNRYGQLGDGGLEDRTRRFKPVAGLPTIRVTKRGSARVASGRNHTCAATREGKAYCWGANQDGQLGVRPGKPCGGKIPCRAVPVQVPGIADALNVVSRYDHSCARLAGGKISCWGKTRYGVTGSRDSRAHEVEGLSSVKQIALGRTHSCVLLHDNTVSCWGMNTDGQCGVGKKTRVKEATPIAWEAPSAVQDPPEGSGGKGKARLEGSG